MDLDPPGPPTCPMTGRFSTGVIDLFLKETPLGRCATYISGRLTLLGGRAVTQPAQGADRFLGSNDGADACALIALRAAPVGVDGAGGYNGTAARDERLDVGKSADAAGRAVVAAE